MRRLRYNYGAKGHMKIYKHILVAVELVSKVDSIALERAELLAKEFEAKITLVHAIENIGSYSAYNVSVGFEIEKILLENANQDIKKLAERLEVPEERQIVKIGSAKFVILEEAEKANVDLIIVGSHGRHGIRVILGSTANAVLHGAKCDVLAVRLKD